MRMRALVIAALCAAGGCGDAPAVVGADDDVLRIVMNAAPLSFDPRVARDEPSQRVHELIYSRLMELDDDLRVVPGLAMRLEHRDPLTYVAHLWSGVRFHDGRALTARDVAYTFNSMRDPGFVSAFDDAFRVLEAVTALDDHRVEFRLTQPVESFPARLVMPVVPDGSGDSLRSFPIGTGPYRFVSYAADEQVVLSAYEGYWDGLPQNAGVVLRIVPDETMRALALRTGAADLAVDAVSPDTAHQLETEGLQVVEAPGIDGTIVAVAQPNIEGVRLTPHAGFLMLKDVRRNLRMYELTN